MARTIHLHATAHIDEPYDSDEEDELKLSSSDQDEKEEDDEEDDDDDEPRRQRVHKVTPKKQSLRIKLNYTPRPERGLRTRRPSQGIKQPTMSAAAPNPGITRRSSRLSHDPEEHLVKLTDSGNHAEVVRQGSRDTEGIPARAMKGGKGIKHPSKSTIDEESQSQPQPEEGEGELEIMASQPELLESDPIHPDGEEDASELNG